MFTPKTRKTVAGVSIPVAAAMLASLTAGPAMAVGNTSDTVKPVSCYTAEGTHVIAVGRLSKKPQRKKGYAYTVSAISRMSNAVGMKGNVKVLEEVPIAGSFFNWKIGEAATTWVRRGEVRTIPLRLFKQTSGENTQWCDLTVTVTGGK